VPRGAGHRPPPGAAEEVDALVLSCVDVNNDRIVRVLTAQDVLVPAVARHNRRASTKRPAHRVQPLTRITAHLGGRPGDDLVPLLNVATTHPFAVVKGDLLRFALASTMAEVVLCTLPDFAAEPGLHDLLARAWTWLDTPSHAPREDLLLLFELRALTLAGALPPIPDLPGLDDGARATLDAWSSGQWRPLAPRDTRGVAACLEGLIADASGRQLRSRAFLDDVLRDLPPA